MKRRFDISTEQTDQLASTFAYSLESALQMALIDALAATAKIQNNHPNVGKRGFPATSFSPEPYDGFYRYIGSIDTPWVAQFLDMVAQSWLLQQEKRKRVA